MTTKINSPPSVTKSGKRRRWFRLSFRDSLKIFSNCLIPLMLGVLALVLSLQQYQLSIRNRENDLAIAKDQREQQLQIEDKRRAQDIVTAKNQQMDTVLNTYFKEMGDLYLKDKTNFTLNRLVLSPIVLPKTLTTLCNLTQCDRLL